MRELRESESFFAVLFYILIMAGVFLAPPFTIWFLSDRCLWPLNFVGCVPLVP